jgi:membrane-bound lytic murein transglycosylase D
VVMASVTPNILLPWDSAVDFERRLEAHPGPLASWTAWTVPSTMTVAQAARQAGMQETELRRVNNIPPGMLVRAGSSLLVPRSEAHSKDVPEHVADNAQLSLQPEIVLKRTTVRARKGETLAQLAHRYGLSPSTVAGWNRLSTQAKLKSRQKVIVMLPQRAVLAQAADGKHHTASKPGVRSAKASSRTAKNQAKAKKNPTRTAKAPAHKKASKVAKTTKKTTVTSKKKSDVKVALAQKANKKR